MAKTLMVEESKEKTTGRRKRKHDLPFSQETPVVTPEERQQLIAESAYYQAERRGFATDDALIDWLEAEKDIDAMLNEPYGDTRD